MFIEREMTAETIKESLQSSILLHLFWFSKCRS